MNLQEIMNVISLPREAREMVLANVIGEKDYQEWKALFYADEGEFLHRWKDMEEHLRWALVFSLQLACEVHGKYMERGLPEQVFDATFYDITIWCEECHRKYGLWGLEELAWIAVSLKMKLFRLGRLQFEPITLARDMDGERMKLKAGTKALNVHIPAGERLDHKECLRSMRSAEGFFGDTYEAYICDSWLMSPALRELLPEESNIVRFQKMFEVIEVYHTYPQAEQRIFQDVSDDKEQYPEDSLLRRRAKEYILAGKDIGIGIGVACR